jgi:hypothetical protein
MTVDAAIGLGFNTQRYVSDWRMMVPEFVPLGCVRFILMLCISPREYGHLGWLKPSVTLWFLLTLTVGYMSTMSDGGVVIFAAASESTAVQVKMTEIVFMFTSDKVETCELIKNRGVSGQSTSPISQTLCRRMHSL